MDNIFPSIPDQSNMRERRRGARKYPTDVDAPENKELPIELRKNGIAGENYYYSEHNPPYMHRAKGAIAELYVREGIFKKLIAANGEFKKLGYELFVFDAYRPIAVQNYFHDEWVPNSLRSAHPDWSEEEIAAETGNYWAEGAPSEKEVNPLSPPQHSTGGVIDCSLRRIGESDTIDMGGAFDLVGTVSFADYLERLADERTLTQEEDAARMNRRILHYVMTKAGFTVNPNEWWHYGFGDQLSAKVSGAPCAVYSKMTVD